MRFAIKPQLGSEGYWIRLYSWPLIDKNELDRKQFHDHIDNKCHIFSSLQVDPYPLMNRIGNITYPLHNVLLNTTTLNALIHDKHSFMASWQLFSSRTATEIADMATNGGITSDWDPTQDFVDLVWVCLFNFAIVIIVHNISSTFEFWF